MKSSLTRKLALALIVTLVLLSFAGLPVSAAAPAPASCFYYTVRWGDSLSSIAWRYGDNLHSLVARNGIPNPNFIRAGQVLYVCSGHTPHPPVPGPMYHTVRWGETLWGIARMYGTTAWALASLNGIYNLNRIYAGQVLRVR